MFFFIFFIFLVSSSSLLPSSLSSTFDFEPLRYTKENTFIILAGILSLQSSHNVASCKLKLKKRKWRRNSTHDRTDQTTGRFCPFAYNIFVGFDAEHRNHILFKTSTKKGPQLCFQRISSFSVKLSSSVPRSLMIVRSIQLKTEPKSSQQHFALSMKKCIWDVV